MASRPPRSESHALLIGVSTGAILFALTLCTGVMFLLPSFSTQWASATQSGPSWTPPAPTSTQIPFSTVEPTSTRLPTATPNVPTSGQDTPSAVQTFKTGDVVTNVNNGPVNMRKTPGYLGKSNSDRIGLVPSGQLLRIVGGPELKDELIWWQVKWDEKTGWMAQSTASGKLILKLAE